MKRALAAVHLWRYGVLIVASLWFWAIVYYSPNQPVLVTILAAFALAAAADFMAMPRNVFWQFVPAIALVGVLLLLPDIPSLQHADYPTTVEGMLVVCFLLGLLLTLFLGLVGLPAMLGATLAWAARTVAKRHEAFWPHLFGDRTPKQITRIGRLASRSIATIFVVGAFVLPSFVPFVGTEGPKVVSPDGRYVAWVREFNCGATCAFHPWVVVRDNERAQFPWFWQAEETTVFDTRHIHPSEISLIWNSDRHLAIKFPNHAPDAITIQKPKWRELTITYNPVQR